MATITPSGSKIWLLSKTFKITPNVKEEHFDRAKFIFKGSEVKITKTGQWHLRAAMENKEFKREYIKSMVNN